MLVVLDPTVSEILKPAHLAPTAIIHATVKATDITFFPHYV